MIIYYLCIIIYNFYPMNNKEDIIKNIKETIKKYGFTQADIAKKMTGKDGGIGICQASLTGIINGNPTLDKLIEIANAVGCSVAELVGGSKDSSIPPSNISINIEGKEYTYYIDK